MKTKASVLMEPPSNILLDSYQVNDKSDEEDDHESLSDVIHMILMLIIEGRLPDTESSRGYKEGLHAKASSIDRNHQCLKSNLACRNSIELKTKIEKYLYSSSTIKASTCIRTFEVDVCLLAKCCHHILNDNLIHNKSNLTYELIEKWSFTMNTSSNIISNTKKFDDTKQVYNAIRSYLHFSQVSSWLNQSNGQLPNTLGYSLMENKTIDDQLIDDNFESHTFPLVNFVNGHILQINLSSKKRTAQLPQSVNCNQQQKCFKYVNNNQDNSEEKSSLITNTKRRQSSFDSNDLHDKRQAKSLRSIQITRESVEETRKDDDLCKSPKVLVSSSSQLLINNFENNLKIFDLNNNECDSVDEDMEPKRRMISDSIHYIRSPTDGVRVPLFNKRPQFQFNSSPAPARKHATYTSTSSSSSASSSFQYDSSLNNVKLIKNAFNNEQINKLRHMFNNTNNKSTSTLTNSLKVQSCLLGSFEESLLNGRLNPVGTVDGFHAELGASGSFFPDHVKLPVHAAFYHICDDIAASPYLGIVSLEQCGKRGYKVPSKGTIQVTLFNPNNTVVKMFVVMYDLSEMPSNSKTFLRQRTMYVPLVGNHHQTQSSFNLDLKSYLRYLIHLRFSTSKTGKLYLHSNIKLIFARNKCEIDPRLAKYEYKTFTEAPKNPRFSCRNK